MIELGRRKLAALSLVIAASSLGAAYWAAKRQGAAGQAPTLSKSWRTGDQQSFDLELSSSVRLGETLVQELELKGRWTLEVVTVDPTLLFRASVTSPALTSKTAADAATSPAYEQELTQPIYFLQNERGEVIEERVPKNMSTFVRGVLKSLPLYAQFVRAEGGASWATHELDTVGRYTGQYSCTAPSSCTKQKRGYDEVFAGIGQSATGSKTRILSAKLAFGFDDHSRLRSLDAAERLEVDADPSHRLERLQADTRLRLSAATARASAAPPMLAAVEPRGFDVERPYETTNSGRRADLDRARIAGRDLRSLLGDLARLKPEDRAARARIHSAMAALFRQNPQQVAEARPLLRSSAQASSVIDALGDAGTAPAQEALRAALAQENDVEQRRRIIDALGHAAPPSAETVTVLAGLFQDHSVGGQARLALGASIRNLQDADPERAAQATSLITNRLDSEPSTGYLIDDLRALGNSGHPATLAAVKPFLLSTSPAVRAAAAQALRFVAGPEADALLAGLVLDDESADVRSGALDSAYYRDRSAVLSTAAVQSVKLDTDDVVRRVAVRVLGKWRRELPAAEEALIWVAAHDPNDKIREVAIEALHRQF